MSLESAKKDMLTMNLIHKKLLELDPFTSRDVIEHLLYLLKTGKDMRNHVRVLSFCANRLDLMDKKDGESLVRFLADRYFSEKPEEIVITETEKKENNDI